MTSAQQLAEFVQRVDDRDMDDEACGQLKVRILDALGCAIGALEAEPPRLVREQLEDLRAPGRCSLIGGGWSSPDQAAFYNSSLVRYLDFNDSYLAKGETCHPSDNLGAVLAASEYANRTGRALMTALGVAYQVQCRLSDVAPVRDKGFDHTTQGSYAVAAGVSKALGLNRAQTANAIAICGTAFNSLRVTRTGRLSHWKGLAYPSTAFSCTYATLLAMRGVTGPPEVFEGNKGFMDAIAGSFEIDWAQESLDRVRDTIVKKYNAEIHSQSALEGILELKEAYRFEPAEIERISIEIFDVAYHIIGGGEEGSKLLVSTKEEADHSLPYLLAVAILDNEVTPLQYTTQRIRARDVQSLLRKVDVRPKESYSQRFPGEMPCRIALLLKDGRRLEREKKDYEGFRTRPFRWEAAVEKFERLSEPYADRALRKEIVDTVAHLEEVQVAGLTRLLAKASVPKNKDRGRHTVQL